LVRPSDWYRQTIDPYRDCPEAETLPSDAVFDALKMILLGAPLNEVLTTITRLIEASEKHFLRFFRSIAKSF
jgi:hypothetical protein